MNCKECRQKMQLYIDGDVIQDKIDLKAPGIDISLPLNFGFGIGLEYPLSHQLDLSLDLGFRSISYGNQIINVGLLFPNNSRINSVVFRVGLVY